MKPRLSKVNAVRRYRDADDGRNERDDRREEKDQDLTTNEPPRRGQDPRDATTNV